MENIKLKRMISSNYNSYKSEDSVISNLEIKCVMNYLELGNNDTCFKVFNCNSCVGKPDNICEMCFEICHKSHNDNIKNVTETLTYMSITKCSCAMNNHQVKIEQSQLENVENLNRRNSKLSPNHNYRLICNLNEVLYKSSEFFYAENSKNFYCAFCYENCQETKNQNFDKVDVKKAKNFECSCDKINNHVPDFENIGNLQKIIDEGKNFNDRHKISIINIPSTILKDSNLVEKYFSPIKKYHEVILEKISSNNILEIQKEPLTKIYTTSVSLLCSLQYCFPCNYTYIKNLEIQKLFNFEFLNKLFECKPLKDDQLLFIKKECLQLFRIYYVEPQIVRKSLENLGNMENISPIHRILLRRNINEFFNDIKIDKKEFFDFIIEVSQQVSMYHDETQETHFNNIFNEYLKIIRILIGYNFDGDDFNFLINICDGLKNIMDQIHLNSKFNHVIHRFLEDLIYNIMINYNDRNIIKFFRPEGNKSNLYSFENSTLSYNLILSLFSYKKDFNEMKSYLENRRIYDTMINNYDYYSESIKTLLEENGKFFISKKELNDLISNQHEKYALQFFGENEIQKIKNGLEYFTEIRNKYCWGELVSEDFYKSVYNGISNFKKEIEILLKHENKKEDLFRDKSLLHKQILLIKFGSFDIIFDILMICDERKNLNSFTNVKLIIKEIFEISIDTLYLVLLNKDSSFFIPLIFTNDAIKLFLQNKSNEKALIFYSKCVKNLTQNKFKLDFSFFIDHLIKLFNLEDVDLISNKEDSVILFEIFKNCLKVANDNSIEIINSRLGLFIKKVISSEEMKNLFNESFRNENTYEMTTNRKFIQMIFNIVNNLSTFSFNFITMHIDSRELENIIYSYDIELDIELRVTLTRTLYKYYIDNPYFVKKLTEQSLDDLTFSVDYNLIGKIYEEELSNFEINPVEEPLINYEELFSTKVIDDDYLPINGIYSKNLSKFEVKAYGLSPLLYNLKKFRSILNRAYLERRKDFKFYFKYFDKMILNPSVKALFKLLYYSNSSSIKIKYMVYTIVQLFLKCCNYFFDLMLDLIKMQRRDSFLLQLITVPKLKIIQDYLCGVPINAKDADILFFIENLKSEISDQIIQLDSITIKDFQIHKIMDKFQIVASKWEPYQKLKNENINFNEKFKLTMSKKVSLMIKDTNSIFQTTYKIYTDYVEKKNNFSKNVLFNIFNNISDRTESMKKSIALDLILSLQSPHLSIDSFSPVNPKNYTYIESLIKLFKVNPDIFQILIVDCSNSTRKALKSLIVQLTYLVQLIFIDFARIGSREFFAYDNVLNILELLRLLCENHNQIFQTLLLKYDIPIDLRDAANFNLTLFLLKINKVVNLHIDHFIKKKNIISYFKNFNDNNTDNEHDQCSFFNRLIIHLHNYFIELLQGSLPSNFEFLSNEVQFNIIYIETVNVICLSSKQHKEFDYFLSYAFKLLNTIFEEKNNINKENFSTFITPRIMLDVCVEAFKKLINLKLNKKSSKNGDIAIEEGDSRKLLEKIMMTSEYYTTPKQQVLFELSSQIYMMLRLIAENNYDNEAQRQFEYLNHLSLLDFYRNQIFLNNENYNQKQKLIAEREVSLFFKSIVKSVEINFKEEGFKISRENFKKYQFFFIDQENDMTEVYNTLKLKFNQDSINPDDQNTLSNKHTLDIETKQTIELETNNKNEDNPSINNIELVEFIVHPSSLHIEGTDIEIFINETYVNHPNMKLYFMLDYYDNVLSTLIKMREKFSIKCQESTLFKVLFTINYLHATKISLFLSFIINLILVFNLSYAPNGELYWRFSYIIYIISFGNLLFLMGLICNFFRFEIYKLNNFIYPASIDDNNLNTLDVNIKNKIVTYGRMLRDYISIAYKEEICTLIWCFICGLIAICHPKFNFAYSLQLFGIFTVYPTMKVVLYSIQLRYTQFLAAGLAIAITALFFSSLTFYFFRSEFGTDDENNMCNSFYECFTSIINYGVRGGSIGFPMRSVNEFKYWTEFTIDWMFYFIIILILINIINGIIVDTFQQLREETVKVNYLKKDVCFICSLKRSDFEIKGADFDLHTTQDHKITNYFHYSIKINLSDKYDLNAIDTFVMQSLIARKIDFMPIKQARALDKKANLNVYY